jgi:hypothetical protein
MQIDRVHADKAFAFLGFALSFLFLLAVVAFACTVGSATNPPAHPSVAGSIASLRDQR